MFWAFWRLNFVICDSFDVTSGTVNSFLCHFYVIRVERGKLIRKYLSTQTNQSKHRKMKKKKSFWLKIKPIFQILVLVKNKLTSNFVYNQPILILVKIRSRPILETFYGCFELLQVDVYVRVETWSYRQILFRVQLNFFIQND